jgi:hypothetical protein
MPWRCESCLSRKQMPFRCVPGVDEVVQIPALSNLELDPSRPTQRNDHIALTKDGAQAYRRRKQPLLPVRLKHQSFARGLRFGVDAAVDGVLQYWPVFSRVDHVVVRVLNDLGARRVHKYADTLLLRTLDDVLYANDIALCEEGFVGCHGIWGRDIDYNIGLGTLEGGCELGFGGEIAGNVGDVVEAVVFG